MKKGKNRLRFTDLIFQIIPVMIGVFLAFLVSNWAENSRNKSKRVLFEKTLIAELYLNRESVKNVLDYHMMLRDSSTYYYQQKKIAKTQFFEGIGALTLNNSAYETGIQTGLINELSFDQIQLVNNTYTHQKNYNEFGTLILSGLISMNNNETENKQRKTYRFLSVSMTDLVIKEQQLLAEYDKILNELR